MNAKQKAIKAIQTLAAQHKLTVRDVSTHTLSLDGWPLCHGFSDAEVRAHIEPLLEALNADRDEPGYGSPENVYVHHTLIEG